MKTTTNCSSRFRPYSQPFTSITTNISMPDWRHFISFTLISMIMSNLVIVVQSRDALQAISENPDLSMFKELIDNEPIYAMMLNKWPITAFAPTNQVIKNFLINKKPESFNSELFKYHIAGLTVKRQDFSKLPTIQSFNPQFPPLYLTVVESNGNSHSNSKTEPKSYYVNNALITEAIEDLKSTDGKDQVVYIIDEVLNSYTAPNAHEFLKQPSNYGYNYNFDKLLKQIESYKLETLFSSPGSNTYFIPSNYNDQTMSQFDDYVIKAHLVNKALFLRTMGDRNIYKTMANDDNVDVELSLINKTLRFTNEPNYYVQTNTIKNDAAHKAGRVLSKLKQSNIPIKNGVIHIIEKPLMLMDMSVDGFISQQPKLKRFQKLLEKHRDVLDELRNNPNKTVLAPDDNAFTNLIDNNQNFAGIRDDSEEMKNLLRQHVVPVQVSSSDLKRSSKFANHTSLNGIPVVFRLIGNEPNTRLTLESGGVNATSLLSDFGASDGIVHIIDRVLGMPFNTIHEKIINNPLLNETYKIGSQGGTQNWNSKLTDENKRYTFFAPSNDAWLQFAQENPSEFKQLDTGIYPSISRAILDRHLSAKGQYNKKDLEQTLRKVDTIQGELVVSPDPATRDIYIEWEGKRAKIISSDIYGLNGVVHVIDKVLAKRRDFNVNSAFTIHCQMILFSTMGLVSILLQYCFTFLN